MKKFMLRVSGNEENGWGIYLKNRYKDREKIIVGDCSNLSDALKFCKGLKQILGEIPIIKEELEKCRTCDGDGSCMHPHFTKMRIFCPVCDGKGWIEKGTRDNYKMK